MPHDDLRPHRPVLRLVGGTDVAAGRDREEAALVPPTAPSPPPVSLMITWRQKGELRLRGFTHDEIRDMTPAEAHQHLGL